jgi:hypothetical protein
LAKNKLVTVSHTPAHPTSLLATFFFNPRMKQLLKGWRFANVAEVQRGSLPAFDSISVDFRQCFQQWQQRWDRCIQSQGEYFEGDQCFKLVRIF